MGISVMMKVAAVLIVFLAHLSANLIYSVEADHGQELSDPDLSDHSSWPAHGYVISLHHLAEIQQPGGLWSSESGLSGEIWEGIDAQGWDIAITAACLLAFLDGGFSPFRESAYQKVCRSSMSALLRIQNQDGCFNQNIMVHSLALAVISRCYSASKDRNILMACHSGWEWLASQSKFDTENRVMYWSSEGAEDIHVVNSCMAVFARYQLEKAGVLESVIDPELRGLVTHLASGKFLQPQESELPFVALAVAAYGWNWIDDKRVKELAQISVSLVSQVSNPDDSDAMRIYASVEASYLVGRQVFLLARGAYRRTAHQGYLRAWSNGELGSWVREDGETSEFSNAIFAAAAVQHEYPRGNWSAPLKLSDEVDPDLLVRLSSSEEMERPVLQHIIEVDLSLLADHFDELGPDSIRQICVALSHGAPRALQIYNKFGEAAASQWIEGYFQSGSFRQIVIEQLANPPPWYAELLNIRFQNGAEDMDGLKRHLGQLMIEGEVDVEEVSKSYEVAFKESDGKGRELLLSLVGTAIKYGASIKTSDD